MSILLIDNNVRATINQVIEHAERNVFTFDDLLDIKNGAMVMAGDVEGFTCTLPYDYRCVYSIEDQPAGRLRHISISILKPKLTPSPIVVSEIMKEFGFKTPLEECQVWFEDISRTNKAINVAEIMEKSNTFPEINGAIATKAK